MVGKRLRAPTIANSAKRSARLRPNSRVGDESGGFMGRPWADTEEII